MTQPSFAPITEDDIANYLANTPDFFERHADLLATVQLTSPHGNRAVSLQERQAQMLRDKIKGLERRIAEMLRHGAENSAIAERLHRWMQQMLLTREARALPGVVTAQLEAQFQVPQVALRLWNLLPEHAQEDYARDVSEDVKTFAASLSQPYCGANRGLEAAQWLAQPQAAASLALIPLRWPAGADVFGLLVLASDDPARFAPDMGTEFLARIGELAAAALSRLLPAAA
jgi:uncharacterized protein YigA (DUF484 family)